MKYDSKNSQLSIFTEREGALSPVGHDLHLEVTKFEIEVSESDTVTGFVDVSSLRVVGSRVDGNTESMAARDTKKIESKIQKDVFPNGKNIQLSGSVSDVVATYGERSVTVEVENQTVLLQSSALGLKPVTAFFGALRVKDTVRIELRDL